MSLQSRVLAALTAVLLLTAAGVSADPITITSGSLRWDPTTGNDGIPVTLSGNNFSFTGTTNPFEGIFTPWDQCSVPECVGGTTVNLHSLWVGMAFYAATVTYNGQTFTAVGSPNASSSMFTEWTGGLAIPLDFTGGTLTAPVALNGTFFFMPGPTVGLVGSGVASLTFVPYTDPSFPDAVRLQSLRFDISPAAATPEPSSMLLVGSGLAAVAAALKRRRAPGLPVEDLTD